MRTGKGAEWPREDRTARDPVTGVPVRQVTAFPAIHHHPFFFVPAYDRAMRRLLFVSHRTGRSEIFFEERSSGRLVQATDRPDLAPWSLSPALDGTAAYFVAGTGAWRLDLDTLEETQFAEFGAVEMREKGMAGNAMGTTALSPSGRWWAVPVKVGPVSRFVLIETATGASRVFLERDTIGHPQFCPNDEDLILYAGPLTDRVWVTDRSGARNRRVHEREHGMQWVTHEHWIPGTREIGFVDWPDGLRAVALDGTTRRISHFPAWHACPSPDGTRHACDTTFPDRGVHLLEGGAARLLCLSESSNEGSHWGAPFPFNDGPVPVQAAQHTHPHPRFAPDASRILFTSDRSGHAQLHEVMLG